MPCSYTGHAEFNELRENKEGTTWQKKLLHPNIITKVSGRSKGRIESASAVPVVRNGDLPLGSDGMVGRAFVRHLGERGDIAALLDRYVEASRAELCGERPVIGRLKELISYWRDIPSWRRLWPVVKIARSLAELRVW